MEQYQPASHKDVIEAARAGKRITFWISPGESPPRLCAHWENMYYESRPINSSSWKDFQSDISKRLQKFGLSKVGVDSAMANMFKA